MVFTKKINHGFYCFFQLWKKGTGFISKCFLGSFQSESWLNWECTMVHFTAHQMNPGALQIEPWLILKWTPMHLEMNPGPFIFSKLKKKTKKIIFLKNKTNIVKTIILENIFISFWSKVNFNLGIPLSGNILIALWLKHKWVVTFIKFRTNVRAMGL